MPIYLKPSRTHYDIDTGKLWAPYRVVYKHQGVEFDVRVQATSFAHAEAMLSDLKKTGEVAGVIVLEEV